MKLTAKVNVNFTFTLVLTEGEIRALDALVGYGFDPFVKVFYDKLGKHYMEPYENDLKNLFLKVEETRKHLTVIDAYKKAGDDIIQKYQP